VAAGAKQVHQFTAYEACTAEDDDFHAQPPETMKAVFNRIT
jgi:hypothetical protein